MPFSLPTDTNTFDAGLAGRVLAALRAEYDRAESEVRRGVLLHEVGVLEDATQNEGQAARDLLSAVNALPEFHEPLERLVALIERRKSYKNLGKLIDRLVKIAGSPEEASRALVALAEFREDQEGNSDEAHDALERATQAKPDDVDAWLELERLAARTGRAAQRRRALAMRATLCTDPAWKGRLWLDVGRLDSALGDTDAAVTSLEHALETKAHATFDALTELIRVTGSEGRAARLAAALEDRSALIARAMEGATEEDAAGVPAELRSAAYVAADLLRAAELHRRAGDSTKAAAHLARVAELVPDDPIVHFARLRAAEAAGDTARAAELSQAELGRDVHGSPAAALWMRVSEAAASSGDARGALDALAKALAEDPACLPARALELHLLAGGDPAALAQALEAAAANFGSEPLAGELFLLSADTAARGASDTSSAKAALSQAAASGAPLEVVARTARMLAALAGDAAWYEEATRRLLATNPPEAERPGLWFEMGRSRLLRGDASGAAEAFGALSATHGGEWLGAALRAYGMPRAFADAAPAAVGAKALAELADQAPTVELSRAFRIAAALRYRLSGLPDEAVVDLQRLHNDDPADLVAALALSTALRRREDPLGAAETLAESALAATEPSVAAALDLEAGILRWLAGERSAALDVFDAAAQLSPLAGSGLYAWALRAAQPNDLAARKRALEAATASIDPAAVAVERFALDVAAGEKPNRALFEVPGDGAVETALELGRALSASSASEELYGALDAIAVRGADVAAVAGAARYLDSLDAPKATSSTREKLAATWSAVDTSLPPTLEWLGQATAAGDADSEVAAREQIARRLEGSLARSVLVSARLIAHLSHPEGSEALLPGSDADVRLANLELSPPSCDPARRAAALLAAGEALEDGSRSASVGLAGWSLLAAGDAPGAIAAFQKYVESHPEDIVGWEGVRAGAELSNDARLLAEASAALGDLVSDPGQGAELWERAATLLLDNLAQPEHGEAALARAVERDIGRKTAFDRLFRLVRSKRDGARLLELIEARLEVVEDATEIVKLYWERARVLREAGNAKGALEALENVTMLEPDHVGALALTGEIHITEKRFAAAAEALSRLSELDEAPTQQRLMSGIAAVDLYENRLAEADRALEVLVGLHRSGLSTLPVRERLARAAARSESWETATTVLEELMEQRETREGRAEAARLAMVLYRDKLSAPERAEQAALRLLTEVPDDGEAIDLALSGVLSKAATAEALEVGRQATIASLIEAPFDLEKLRRLAEIARQMKDVPMRQVALGAVVALGGQSQPILAELSQLDARIARVPRIAIDDSVVNGLRDPEDHGAIPALMQALAPTIAEAIGPGLAALGVTKKERVRPQDGLPVRNEVAAWGGALGIGEFEFYVGGRDRKGVFAVATEVPSVVIGSDVAHPLSAVHRGSLARALLALRLGTTALLHHDATEVAALITAACNLGGVRLDSPPYAMLAEFERLLGKEMQRRVRRVLPELAAAVRGEGTDITAWARAAMATLDRMAAAAIGDVSWVLGGSSGQSRGERPETQEGKLRAERVLSFVISKTAFDVREKLGLGVR